MKDIGYYAGFLSTEDQQTINESSIANIAAGITTIGGRIWQDHNDPDKFAHLDISYPKSELDSLALIRGLCDRIELKLMETAQ